jgi:hypothetical protein
MASFPEDVDLERGAAEAASSPGDDDAASPQQGGWSVPAVIVFGRRGPGRPRAGWFSALEVDQRLHGGGDRSLSAGHFNVGQI